MKALTLTQPWATLVSIGAKKWETRSWLTNYRGPIAIHAAKGLGLVGGISGLVALCQTEPFREVLYPVFGYPKGEALVNARSLPLGAVIAIVNLTEIQRTRSRWNASEKEVNAGIVGQFEWAFGDYSSFRFAWRLENVRRLPEPIPAKGALGLWQWTCPHAHTSIGHSFDNIITVCDDCGEDIKQEGCQDCQEALARGDDEPAAHGCISTNWLHVTVVEPA